MVRETALIVTDVLHHTAGDFADQLAIDHRLAVDHAEQLAAALARHHDLVGGGERLTAEPGVDETIVGNAGLHVSLDECIEDGIGNLVADLVRMPLGDRLAGEEKILMGHVLILPCRTRHIRCALRILPRRMQPSRIRFLSLRSSCSVRKRGQGVGRVGCESGRWDAKLDADVISLRYSPFARPVRQSCGAASDRRCA